MNDTQRQARLRQLAQEIWEAEGRPDGHADRHWAMAERLVEAEIRAAEQGGAAPAGPRIVASS
ncbi:DUF2934 domain-containing protein [Xanthomonas campestris pv. campestris]|nr:DUF2934 domain-containing protein [Xanthomonas campestris pv. campestris]